MTYTGNHCLSIEELSLWMPFAFILGGPSLFFESRRTFSASLDGPFIHENLLLLPALMSRKGNFWVALLFMEQKEDYTHAEHVKHVTTLEVPGLGAQLAVFLRATMVHVVSR
ncbi:hypothetical protein AMTRI_Chr01g103970 [Amborella trichopoda]